MKTAYYQQFLDISIYRFRYWFLKVLSKISFFLCFSLLFYFFSQKFLSRKCTSKYVLYLKNERTEEVFYF